MLLLLSAATILLLASSLTPHPVKEIDALSNHDGLVTIEGVVVALREEPGRRIRLLLTDATAATWVVIEEPPAIARGDRLRLQAEVRSGHITARGDGVERLAAGPARFLREIATTPWSAMGPLAVEATVDSLTSKGGTLTDSGHRLRVESGRLAWPPDVGRGRRVVAEGRLVFDPELLRFVLLVDGMRHV